MRSSTKPSSPSPAGIAAPAPSAAAPSSPALEGKKNRGPPRESSFNRYREIRAPELAQHARDAVFRSRHLDLPALHLEHVLRAVRHADLATLAPLEVDFYDRLFLPGSLAFSHPDHIRSRLLHATRAIHARSEKARSKLEPIYTSPKIVASLFDAYGKFYSG
jgi:hypothetical protein